MKVAFAGTPDFARVALDAICDAGFEVPLVLSQPDRPAGRGMRTQASAVKQAALQRRLTVIQPVSLRLDGKHPNEAAAARAALLDANADVMVVAAYGLILPKWVLTLPRFGCLNIHASLLPRWRGAAPIQRAIEAGDPQTGITVMQMDEGLDTGAMLLHAAEAIGDDDTSSSLHERLALVGAKLVVEALKRLEAGRPLVAQPQPSQGVTYAPKIDKQEARIDWRQPATSIARRARAFDPFPGLMFTHGSELIKVWRARAVSGQGRPGTILKSEPGQCRVACGEGALELLVLQRPGSRRLECAEFVRGHPIEAGTVLDLPA